MSFAGRLLTLAITSVLVANAHAVDLRTSEPSDEQSGDQMPMYRLRLPGHPLLTSTAFSPDGERLFIRHIDQAINVWELAVYYWPEVLGFATGAALLALSLVLRGISRRKRIVGEPHCRVCNYCLKGSPGDCCPECGEQIRRPVRGRPMWIRVMPCTALMLLCVAGYGSLWVMKLKLTGFGVDRDGRKENAAFLVDKCGV